MITAIQQILLRVTNHVAGGMVAPKNSALTYPEEDNNFWLIYQALLELTTSGNVAPYNPATTYSIVTPMYVSYAGNIYLFVNATPTAGITPGTNPAYWQLTSIGALAHVQNTDQYLDAGGPFQVGAIEIKAYLKNHIISVTLAEAVTYRDAAAFFPGFMYFISDKNVLIEATSASTYHRLALDMAIQKPTYYDIDTDTKTYLSDGALFYYDASDGKFKDTNTGYDPTGSGEFHSTFFNLKTGLGGAAFARFTSDNAQWQLYTHTSSNWNSKINGDENGILIVQEESSGQPLSGVATLIAGVVTVNTAGISSTKSRVMMSRQSINGSTAIGELTVGTIVNAVSFQIKALKPDTTTETNDISKIHWWIVNAN